MLGSPCRPPAPRSRSWEHTGPRMCSSTPPATPTSPTSVWQPLSPTGWSISFPPDTYTAPERPAGHPTVAGDVYSLGVLAAELLCGEPPSGDGNVPSLGSTPGSGDHPCHSSGIPLSDTHQWRCFSRRAVHGGTVSHREETHRSPQPLQGASRLSRGRCSRLLRTVRSGDQTCQRPSLGNALHS